jgi:WD40 repeat protein
MRSAGLAFADGLVSNGAAFAPDGRHVLTGSQDVVAMLWDAQMGERVGRFAAHNGFVWDVAFAPDGASPATTSFDGTVRL